MTEHRWDLSPAEARALQERLRHEVIVEDDLDPAAVRTLAGADVGFEEGGAWLPLEHHNEVIGAVLRSRAGTKPLYVSPGHRVSLETAVALTLRAVTRYRLPETTRAAHRLASG